MDGRREACTAPNPRGRREPTSDPFMPPHRSNRARVKNTVAGGRSEMPRVEEADESKTEDEYIPSKSLTPFLLCKMWIWVNSKFFGFCFPCQLA